MFLNMQSELEKHARDYLHHHHARGSSMDSNRAMYTAVIVIGQMYVVLGQAKAAVLSFSPQVAQKVGEAMMDVGLKVDMWLCR